MRKTYIIRMAVLTCFCALALSGCGEQKPNVGQDPGNQSPSRQSPTPTPTAPSPSVKPSTQGESKKQQIQSYFGDDEGNKLVTKNVTISYTTDESKYLAALETLKKSPASDAVSLCPNTVFRSAVLKNGTLTVDMTIPASDNLGSGGEQLLLDAIQKTLFQFNEVQSIDLLVGGKRAESLMGHVELSHPIKRK